LKAKLTKLKREAREAAINRGHVMSRFETFPSGTAIASCKKCGYIAAVRVRPAANEIDIAGSAVALNCLWKRIAA
jgi:hypothetical protein